MASKPAVNFSHDTAWATGLFEETLIIEASPDLTCSITYLHHVALKACQGVCGFCSHPEGESWRGDKLSMVKPVQLSASPVLSQPPSSVQVTFVVAKSSYVPLDKLCC
ncbi:hypothetical protein BsWGS_25463 [Bradybaena similaris]